MSTAKKGLLGVYAVLAILAITQGDVALGQWSLRILMILAAVHVVEVLLFFKVCRDAGGSMPCHIVNLFFFGILHVQEIKAAQAKS